MEMYQRQSRAASDAANLQYTVGKATRIWYSEDKFTEKPRWDRMMKKIK